MSLRYVSTVVAVIVVAAAISVGPAPSGEAAQGAVASTSAVVPACDLRLPPPTSGEPHFAIPRGGRATLRALAGGFRLCRLLRADGSRFAQAEIDRLRQVLELRFFRRSGTLLFASDAQFPAKTTAEGADVGCNNDAYGTIGPRNWQQPHKWWVGKTPSGLAADKVVQALRSAYSEWANNINWCDLADNAKAQSDYQGRTELKAKQDGTNVVHWGSLEDVQGCSGALACAATWYDERGQPGRVGHPFQHRREVVDQPGRRQLRHPVGRGPRVRTRSPVRPRHERGQHRGHVAVHLEGRHVAAEARPRRLARQQHEY